MCSAELAAGALRCDLTTEHHDLHWDRGLYVVWFPWTDEDEAEVAKATGAENIREDTPNDNSAM